CHWHNFYAFLPRKIFEAILKNDSKLEANSNAPPFANGAHCQSKASIQHEARNIALHVLDRPNQLLGNRALLASVGRVGRPAMAHRRRSFSFGQSCSDSEQ